MTIKAQALADLRRGQTDAGCLIHRGEHPRDQVADRRQRLPASPARARAFRIGFGAIRIGNVLSAVEAEGSGYRAHCLAACSGGVAADQRRPALRHGRVTRSYCPLQVAPRVPRCSAPGCRCGFRCLLRSQEGALTTRMFTSPLFLGFDHLEQMLERASKTSSDGYPPYNIEQISQTGLRITLAVAGFTMDDLQITQEDNQLVIRGGRQTTARAGFSCTAASRRVSSSGRSSWPKGSR